MVACVGCSRWLLVPWLVMYMLNTLFLLGLAVGMFAVPLPILHDNMANTIEYQMLRYTRVSIYIYCLVEILCVGI